MAQTYDQRHHGIMDATYIAARGLVLWLMLLNPGFLGLIVSGGAMFGFGAQLYLLQQQESSKDAAQDARMDASDARDTREELDRIDRRQGITNRLNSQSVELRELSDTVSRIVGWGLGAFGAVSVLQIIGLLRKNKDD